MGSSETGGLLDESATMAPLTPYAETKVTAEEALAKLADDDFSPTYMRNATVYGPSPSLRLDIVVNDLCATAAATGRILLKSDGRAWRPQVHVEDVGLFRPSRPRGTGRVCARPGLQRGQDRGQPACHRNR